MTAVVVIEGIAVALLGLLVAGLLRSHAEILRQLHVLGGGQAPGAGPILPGMAPTAPGISGTGEAHDLVGETPAGETAAVSVVGAPHPTLLAFLSSSCLTCTSFWDRFAEPAPLGLREGTRLVIVTRSVHEESPSRLAALAPPQVTVIMSTEAWMSYGVPGAPYFILVDGPTGRVYGEGTAARWDQVVSLLTQASADRAAMLARAGHQAGRDDAARIDAELLAAGIEPGHPSLYPASRPEGRSGEELPR
jgi:hypothetical protein